MKNKINLLLIIIITNLIWYFIFNSFVFNFWLRIVIAITVLNLMVLAYQNYDFSFSLSELSWGLISAVVLYVIFAIGKNLSGLILAKSQEQIMNVYALKKDFNLFMISSVLVIVGGGEELFWRGFLQEKLMKGFGKKSGYILASVMYGLVHLWTGNFILVLAALTAGLFWGYLFLRNKSLTMVIISHITWDLLIFVIIPLDF
ncbi:MAG: CPBP family intramembrane glutamic endopeptidase [Bacillota bacterium]